MRKLVSSKKKGLGISCLLTCRLLSYKFTNWKVLLISEISFIII